MSFYNDPAYQTVRSLRTELTEELSRNMSLWHYAMANGWHTTSEYYRVKNAVLRDKLNAVLAVLDMIVEQHRAQ